MPTRYTESIGEGISFKRFVLQCSRAFGAFTELRDVPLNDESAINDFLRRQKSSPSDHHLKAKKEAEIKLKELSSLKQKEIQERYHKERNERLTSYKTHVKEHKELKQKYESMLKKVKQWTPPSNEHRGLKHFMEEQITESIEFDCYVPNEPKYCDMKEWYEQEKDRCVRDIEYHRKEYDEEVKRHNERILWIQTLIESLKNYQ